MKKIRKFQIPLHVILFSLGLLIFLAFLTLNPKDDTDGAERSGLRLHTDHKTGLQYLSTGRGGGLTPRLDENGNHMKVSNQDGDVKW